MSGLDSQTPSSGSFNDSSQARDIYVSVWDGNAKAYGIHKLDGISDDLKREISQYMVSDRDMHDGGFLYEYESFMDQLKKSGIEIMRMKEVDLALEKIRPDLGFGEYPPRDESLTSREPKGQYDIHSGESFTY